MKNAGRILIAGCGYVGGRLAGLLAADGHEVFGLRRSPGTLAAGVTGVRADLGDPATLASLPAPLDAVVYAAGPAGRDEAAYRAAYVDGMRNLLAACARFDRPPRRLLFVSSTGVYAQDDGGWVDESSPAEPTSFTGRTLLQAERVALGSAMESTVLRLGGIYGPGRTWLIERVRRGEARPFTGAPRYTNRIHRDDAAGALRHLLFLENAESLYLGVDGHPGEHNEVLSFIARELGVPLPPPAAEGEMPPGRSGNKRCRNRRLQRSGYRFRFPTFREGYASLIRGERSGRDPGAAQTSRG